MTIELIKDIADNVIVKGFRPNNNTITIEKLLIASELFEAFEDLRANKLQTYYVDKNNQGHEFEKQEYKNNTPTRKPCGFYSELADVAIRAIDYLVNVQEEDLNYILNNFNHSKNYENYNDVETNLTNAIQSIRLNDNNIWFDRLLNSLFNICNRADVDLIQEIKIKHEYNKTRPYKHGKKF